MTGNTFAPEAASICATGDYSGRSARGSAIREGCLRPRSALRKRG
jgi:hypothetical protein